MGIECLGVNKMIEIGLKGLWVFFIVFFKYSFLIDCIPPE